MKGGNNRERLNLFPGKFAHGAFCLLVDSSVFESHFGNVLCGLAALRVISLAVQLVPFQQHHSIPFPALPAPQKGTCERAQQAPSDGHFH
jgi:hypothetical protein